MLADATSMHSTIQSIDSDYQCGNVSWNDKKRGVTENGSLSVFGSLINDASLADPEGHNFPFVRGDNHDEPLGVVRSSDITLIVGNTPTTLHEILKDPSFCKYRGFGELALGKKDGNGEVVDEKVVVRMQQAFVPMKKGETQRDVVVRNYSYATVSNDDPASLMLVGSPQGTHVHTDSLGDAKLHAHSMDSGTVTKHYFTAERTTYSVGSAQVGDDDDASSPPKKAKAVEMGLSGMGPRANCLMIVSIPRQQVGGGDDPYDETEDDVHYCSLGLRPVYRGSGLAVGEAKVARMSINTDASDGVAEPLTMNVLRNHEAPIDVTFIFFNTVEAPDEGCTTVDVSRSDLVNAIDDLKRCYRLCNLSCKLSKLPVMLEKMTPAVMKKIVDKATVDPPPCKDKEEEDLFIPKEDASARVWAK